MASNSAGVFSAMGGDIVVMVDIVPDPLIIESQLMEVAGNLENTMKPMLAARKVAQEDIQAHFDTESDPDGTKWTELDLAYAQYKESLGYPPDILHREGSLEKAAVSDAAFTVTPYGMWFNWDALPRAESDGSNYGQIHQAGSVGEGAELTIKNPFTGEMESTRISGVGTGAGKNLPARPFVGMSEDAEASFWYIFDTWFDESIEVAIHPKTGTMQMRGVSGRFGRKII